MSSVHELRKTYDYFLRKQVFRTMLLPSILQSTSSGFSVKRILFTFVPLLITIDAPFHCCLLRLCSPQLSRLLQLKIREHNRGKRIESRQNMYTRCHT